MPKATLTRPFHGVPDDEISAALAEADPGVLLAVLVHLTGDAHWGGEPYRGEVARLRAARFDWDPATPFDAELLAQIHDAAGELCRALREGDAHPVRDPDDATLTAAIIATVGCDPGPAYLDKLRCEFGLDGAIEPTPVCPSAGDAVLPRVTVIGAGVSGLCMAMRLQQTGFEVDVYEKNDDVGGVWLENIYPGCGVDTDANQYRYTFTPGSYDWTRFLPSQREILRYLQSCATDAGLRQRVRFGVEVVSAEFVPERSGWRLTLRAGSGPVEVVETDIVVWAGGALNRPNLPAIPDRDSFRGPIFHTARWPRDLTLSGRRVGVIGNGSSGVQVGRAIAAEASTMTHFMRTPHWVAPNPGGLKEIPAGCQLLRRELPWYLEWDQVTGFVIGDLGHSLLRRDPDWPGPGISAGNEELRALLTGYIRHELDGRDDLIEKVLPQYPPFTKRLVLDNQWYRTLARDNVRLVTEAIERITPDGIMTADGEHHDLDVIVLATGFNGTKAMWPIEVRGRAGKTFAEVAGGDEELRAYLGTTTPGYPNLFMIFGPNSGFGHSGSATFIAEAQSWFIRECVVAMVNSGGSTVEITEEACAAYNDRIDRELEQMVWSEPGISSRYKSRDGRIVTTQPWTLQQFWTLTRVADRACLDIR